MNETHNVLEKCKNKGNVGNKRNRAENRGGGASDRRKTTELLGCSQKKRVIMSPRMNELTLTK